jgi:hypothetical protein
MSKNSGVILHKFHCIFQIIHVPVWVDTLIDGWIMEENDNETVLYRQWLLLYRCTLRQVSLYVLFSFEQSVRLLKVLSEFYIFGGDILSMQCRVIFFHYSSINQCIYPYRYMYNLKYTVELVQYDTWVFWHLVKLSAISQIVQMKITHTVKPVLKCTCIKAITVYKGQSHFPH